MAKKPSPKGQKNRTYTFHDVGGRQYQGRYPTDSERAERQKRLKRPPGSGKP
jgi:hypothetical protein